MNTLGELLCLLTTDCKDDGCSFTVKERLELIEALLEETPYKPVAREPLAVIYSKDELHAGRDVVLVSSHVDSVYENYFCSDEGDCFRGTFDNSFSNAAALWSMINGKFADNVAIAFTGDEEKDSQGAVQAVCALGKIGCNISFALVQDVTNVGWESGALFAIENDSNIDILTAHSLISSLEQYSGRFAFCHNAEPDESWDYADYGIPCLTLSAPVCGNLHGEEGVLLRKESAAEYCNALSLLANLMAARI